MERPPPALGGAPPAAVHPPSTMVSQFQSPIQHPIQHITAEQLMNVNMYTVSGQASSPTSMSINIRSTSSVYSPPVMSPIQHQAMFPPVAPFPPPSAQSSGRVFNLMRRMPSVVPVSETFRLSHPFTSHLQSLVSWVTQPQTPPVYPFPPPPRFPHPPPLSSPATMQVPSFSQLTHASECVLPSPGHRGPLQHADVHSMQSPMQQVTPEPQFVPLHHLSHVPNPQYPHQWQSHTTHYWSASTKMTSHQQQVEHWSRVPGHSRNGAQITRPIPVYRYPMPVCTRPSSSMHMHDESLSTSMHEGTLTSVYDASLHEISVEDEPHAQEESRGQLETPSEAKIQSDAKELDEYKEFSAAFKSHRLKMGYSQADVVQQVAIRYGACISQERIDQFEGLQLTITVVRTLKATLEQWVRDTAKASGTSEEEIKEIIVSPTTSINSKRGRKQRTSVDACIKDQLEAEFQRKRKPTKVEMGLIANRLHLDKEFVRIWFCNRRQCQKKRESATTTVGLRGSSDTDAIKIPSPSHDITVEVPSTSQEGGYAGSCQAAVYIVYSTLQ